MDAFYSADSDKENGAPLRRLHSPFALAGRRNAHSPRSAPANTSRRRAQLDNLVQSPPRAGHHDSMRHLFDSSRNAYESGVAKFTPEDPFWQRSGLTPQHLQSQPGVMSLSSRSIADIWTRDSDPNVPSRVVDKDTSDEWTGDEEFYSGRQTQNNNAVQFSPHQLDGAGGRVPTEAIAKIPLCSSSRPGRTHRIKSYYHGHIPVGQVPGDISSGLSTGLRFHSSSDWTTSDPRGSRIGPNVSSVHQLEETVRKSSLSGCMPSPVREKFRTGMSGGLAADLSVDLSAEQAAGRPVTLSRDSQHDCLATDRVSPTTRNCRSSPAHNGILTGSLESSRVCVSTGFCAQQHWPVHTRGELLDDADLDVANNHDTAICPSETRSPAIPWSPLSPAMSKPKSFEAGYTSPLPAIFSTPTHRSSLYPRSSLNPATPPYRPRVTIGVATSRSSDADDEKDRGRDDELLSPLSPDVEIHRGARRHRRSTRFHTPSQALETRERRAS